ncbi:hypothetical protein B0I35DRAFT_407323 [Stachybotrys elegans]|uniref:Uncharacterized protein n=1 Tax=Stachybotrys elegans TaxID=80388 RepID=A0A8K0SXH9_9HYPO|nr:hypothetical protein B0I35DRAFT_407323 [Stachybotrys elegans]
MYGNNVAREVDGNLKDGKCVPDEGKKDPVSVAMRVQGRRWNRTSAMGQCPASLTRPNARAAIGCDRLSPSSVAPSQYGVSILGMLQSLYGLRDRSAALCLRCSREATCTPAEDPEMLIGPTPTGSASPVSGQSDKRTKKVGASEARAHRLANCHFGFGVP